MQQQFIKSFGAIQKLFHQLQAEGKITPEQAQLFNDSQKSIVNFHSWVKNQLSGNIKVELPWSKKEFVEAWKLWRQFKKQQFKFTYQPIGEQGALKDLADLSGGEMNTAIAIIHQSIKKGWRGFFELKQQKTITKQLVESQNTDYKQQLLNRLNGGNNE